MVAVAARLEIHHYQQRDYDRLHAAMAQIGFLRSVVAVSGVEYQLDTGMYCNMAYSGTPATAERLIKTVADTIRPPASIMVFDASTMVWSGLKPVVVTPNALRAALTPWERRYGGTGLAAGLEPGGAFSALFGVKIRGPLDGIS